MKKTILAVIMSLLMAVTLTGCGNKTEFDFLIENHNWMFSNMVDNEKGSVVACGEAVCDLYPDAEVMNLTCKAAANVMAIRDAESGDGAEISYSGLAKDTNSRTYELVYQKGEETIKGMAVSSITEYAKGEYEYTLVVDMDGYALYFYDRESVK